MPCVKIVVVQRDVKNFLLEQNVGHRESFYLTPWATTRRKSKTQKHRNTRRTHDTRRRTHDEVRKEPKLDKNCRRAELNYRRKEVDTKTRRKKIFFFINAVFIFMLHTSTFLFTQDAKVEEETIEGRFGELLIFSRHNIEMPVI